MKTIYIPKGETVRYESLVTENLIVKGSLTVTYGVKATHISGNGVISAGEISADTIRADELECSVVICKRLIAKRVSAPEVFASESAAVSCFLSAAYVETPRLTVAISEIDEVKADEVINLKSKKRGLLGTLLASAWRSFWLPRANPTRSTPVDAEYKPVDETESADPEPDADTRSSIDLATREDITRTVREIMEQEAKAGSSDAVDGGDFELKRFISMFNLCRDSGYTLRIVPGTPEENAPVFDFEKEEILRPAA